MEGAQTEWRKFPACTRWSDLPQVTSDVDYSSSNVCSKQPHALGELAPVLRVLSSSGEQNALQQLLENWERVAQARVNLHRHKSSTAVAINSY